MGVNLPERNRQEADKQKQSSEYAEYNQRHTYPIDEFVGGILMGLLILIQIGLNRAQVLF